MHNINIPYTLDLCLRRQNSAWIYVNPLSDRLSCHYRGHPAFDTTEMMMNIWWHAAPTSHSTKYIVQSSKHSTLDTDKSGTGSSVASSSFWPADKPCRLNGHRGFGSVLGTLNTPSQAINTRTHAHIPMGWTTVAGWWTDGGRAYCLRKNKLGVKRGECPNFHGTKKQLMRIYVVL